MAKEFFFLYLQYNSCVKILKKSKWHNENREYLENENEKKK